MEIRFHGAGSRHGAAATSCSTETRRGAMSKFVSKVVIPLAIWYAVVAFSISAIYLLAGKTSPGPETKGYLIFSGILGFIVVLRCWSVCERLRCIGGVLVGLTLGAP